MGRSIEIYIRNEDVLVPVSAYLPILSSTLSKWSFLPKDILKVYSKVRVVPEEDRKALEIASEVSRKMKVRLKIYDICSWEGKLKAKLKRVKKTPTIIVGNRKIEGVPEKEELISLF